jgi:hypothetical protein
MERKDFLGLSSLEDLKGIRNLKKILKYIILQKGAIILKCLP